MLESLKTKFQQFAEAVTGPPSRDALARERDQLLAAPPLAPVNALAEPAPLTCTCPHCTTRADEEQRRRVTFGSWAARVHALEGGLFQLVWGNPESTDDVMKGRDEPGLALAELCTELLHAIDATRMRPWERIIERDGRGKPLKAWETAPQIGALTGLLVALYRHAHDEMIYLGSAALAAAIEDTRARMGAALMAPLRRPMDPGVAEHAGTQSGEKSEGERHGLAPGAAGDPSVLAGTIRFRTRGAP